MKILHTSDWHLGMAAGQLSLKEDQRYFLQELCGLIQKESIGAVLLAGDVYDSSVANAEAIGLYNEAMTRLCMELRVPVIAIAGNHDSAARLASCRELLRGAGLYVTGRLEKNIEPVLLDGGRAAVYSLPFFNREEVLALFPDHKEEIRTQEQAVEAVCEKLRREMDPDRVNILVHHGLIVDAELSESDRSARVGFATAVSREVFRGFDYVALGHIHKPQVIDDHIRYSGSPMKYSFGQEERQEKGVVIFDTDSGAQRFVPLKPLHDRLSAEGTLEELLSREELGDAYLRLYVKDHYAGLELISRLRERFPNLLEVYGKGIGEEQAASQLSLSQLKTLSKTDILEKFLGETFSYTPSEDQRQLFREVLEWSREEGDLG